MTKLSIIQLSLVLAFLGFNNKIFAQQLNCDSIVWKNNKKLTWNDFKGKAEVRSIAAAMSNINFIHQWRVEKGILIAKVICIFSPCRSWTKNTKSAYLLKHEQGHFDIAEYFRRLYNKRITEEKYSPHTLKLIMLKTYVDIQLEYLRTRYDEETNHSLDKDKQNEWNKKIDKMLKSLEAYSTEEVRVKLPRIRY